MWFEETDSCFMASVFQESKSELVPELFEGEQLVRSFFKIYSSLSSIFFFQFIIIYGQCSKFAYLSLVHSVTEWEFFHA